MKLTIYHTNDIHSHLNEYARIQSYMTEHRSKLQHPSLYLDIGDHVDLSAPITQATLGKKNIELFMWGVWTPNVNNSMSPFQFSLIWHTNIPIGI